jgi:hypothetical protein
MKRRKMGMDGGAKIEKDKKDKGDNMMRKPTMSLNELPEALQHTMLIELAQVFCRRLGRPRANDIEQAGFHDLADLLLRGWILREPGRYSIGYQPGEAVIREMWQLDPTLCSLLRLPPPLVSSVEGVDEGKMAA